MKPQRSRRGALGLGVLFAALVIACGGASSSPAATRSPQATASPTADLGPPQPQAERIMAHIRFFAGEIGTRLAGSPEEAEAAGYAKQQFESWGYRVMLQSFPASGELLRRSSVGLTDGTRSFRAVAFYGSGQGSVSDRLVDGGTGRAAEFPPDARGAIVLIQRKDVPFTDMVSRARTAGAAAVVVANREPGLFIGALSDPADLPVIAIDQADGDALRGLPGNGPFTVTVGPVPTVTANNVIARPPDGHCRTITGGHYDTVPVSVGATDNASGAATVLELARAAAAAGLSGNCFALFSAEEEGLLGSAYFVEHLAPSQRAELRAMFNYDVTAGAPPIELIGDEELVQRGLELAAQRNASVSSATLPEGTSSDLASFLAAGIPALMLTADDMGIIHTPRDSLANVRQEPLQPIADLGFALIQESYGGATPVSTP